MSGARVCKCGHEIGHHWITPFGDRCDAVVASDLLVDGVMCGCPEFREAMAR